MESTHNAEAWATVVDLVASVAMALPIPNFTVAGLMKLSAGSVLSTAWPTNRDLPLQVNGQLVAWGEFETTGDNVGIRVTEFAWEQSHISE